MRITLHFVALAFVLAVGSDGIGRPQSDDPCIRWADQKDIVEVKMEREQFYQDMLRIDEVTYNKIKKDVGGNASVFELFSLGGSYKEFTENLRRFKLDYESRSGGKELVNIKKRTLSPLAAECYKICVENYAHSTRSVVKVSVRAFDDGSATSIVEFSPPPGVEPPYAAVMMGNGPGKPRPAGKTVAPDRKYAVKLVRGLQEFPLDVEPGQDFSVSIQALVGYSGSDDWKRKPRLIGLDWILASQSRMDWNSAVALAQDKTADGWRLPALSDAQWLLDNGSFDRESLILTIGPQKELPAKSIALKSALHYWTSHWVELPNGGKKVATIEWKLTGSKAAAELPNFIDITSEANGNKQNWEQYVLLVRDVMD